jgi:hypothetical protein
MPNEPATNIATGIIPAAPWRIQAISALPGHRLAVTFKDGSLGIADCSTIRTSAIPGIYAPLADPEFFNQVQIKLGALTWPNGADLDPAWLHENLSAGETWAVPF